MISLAFVKDEVYQEGREGEKMTRALSSRPRRAKR